MKGLMLHCGGYVRSRNEVFAIPPPSSTESYMPLPYESFITRIEKQLVMEGFRIRDQILALAHNGQRLFGLMQVEMPQMGLCDYGCVLGLRNSYDKSCSAGLCIGATVFVCDNLSFHGSLVTFERKHTPNLLRDLSWIITETVAKLPALFAVQSQTFEVYRQTNLSDDRVHDLVIRCYDKGGLNLTDIPRVLREWRNPRHSEFLNAGKTAWRLFNAATETIKGDLWRLPLRTRAIHEVLDTQCGLTEQMGPKPAEAALTE
jgi:hypothetical protein